MEILPPPTQAEAADGKAKPDLRSLPFGLKRYRPGMFHTIHAAGSKIITASLVPGLFGESRFHGRFAVMCHVSGLVPLPEFGNEALMERGNRLEAVAIQMIAEEKGWQTYQPRAYVVHPTIDRLIASPDALAWHTLGGEPGIGEIKVVADMIYQKLWMDGPPLDVQLQHQTQFACTGAQWGFIAVLVVGGFRWDLLVYETTPDQRVIDIIEAEVVKARHQIDEGDMGAPDEHRSSIAAAHALWTPVAGKELLLNDPEADERLERWLQAKADRVAAEKVEEAQQRYFAARALDHAVIKCPSGGFVTIADRKRKAFSVPASTYRVMTPKDPAAAAGGDVDE